MECNKDDAIKAKAIAERKFSVKDIRGAKKFALKAKALYPGLEGISQMLATLDIYVAADNQMYGEADWYGVLGSTPQADEDTIRKQYRKLALMLHPDKNKSIGAEGAFKLISEAWSLLSDKNKRAAYDAKRSVVNFQPKAQGPSESPSMPSGANGFYNFAKPTTSNVKVNKNTSRSNGSLASGSTNNPTCKTFWTVCHRCKMQYEYLRNYLHNNLLCPNCQKPFFAIETPPPVSNSSRSSTPWNASQHRQKSHHEARDNSGRKVEYGTGNFQWTPFSGAAGTSSFAQAANVVQQSYEKVKRAREEAQAAMKREKAMKRRNNVSENIVGPSFEKKRRPNDDVGMNSSQRVGAAGFGTAGSVLARHGGSEKIQTSRNNILNITRELSWIELRDILMDKARKEISKKLSEWKSARKEKAVDYKTNGEVNGKIDDQESGKPADSGQRAEDEPSKNATFASALKEMLHRLSIPVPDPDFHDFDKARTEAAFQENQVWAVYDNDDGMPRYYAMIHGIISRDPFRVRIGWLNSSTNTELGPLNWVGSKTCGDFRIGRPETHDGLYCFSHKVRWTKDTRGAIRIFPRKGDVWALYRNWLPDWDELTPDELIHKYEMVEVLEDYGEELGVVVIPLVKVAGFKVVFHQHLDSEQVRRIPKEEICRFSYQVPSHLLSGHEGPSAPKGCRELDPAALPLEFLQVIADVKEKDIVEDQPTQEEKFADSIVKKPSDIDPKKNSEETKVVSEDARAP